MKKIKFYEISRQQFDATEYRPLGIEICEEDVYEDNWTYGDLVNEYEPDHGYHAELVHDTGDLLIWRVFNDDSEQFICEIVD